MTGTTGRRKVRGSRRIEVWISHQNALISAGLLSVLNQHPDFEAVARGPDCIISPEGGADALPDVMVGDYETGMRLLGIPAYRHKVVILAQDENEVEVCLALKSGARGYLLLGDSPEALLDGFKRVHMGEIAFGPSVLDCIAGGMRHRRLTRRELDVLGQLMLGMSNKVIALQLAVSVGTVKTHVKSILEKLEAVSRTQAVAIAQRRGLVRLSSSHLPGSSSGRLRQVELTERIPTIKPISIDRNMGSF
jgi:two-component system, NarL family, response regulator